MRNCTLLLLCIGVLIAVSYADEVENEAVPYEVQELDSELLENVLFGRCRREGQDVSEKNYAINKN